MKILVIAPDKLPLPPIKGGSVETVMNNIVTRMAGSVNVTVISCKHPGLPTIHHASNGKLKFVRFPYVNGESYIKAAMRKMRKQRFDLVQIDNRPTFLPAIRQAFPRTPIILSLHSLHFLSRLSLRRGNEVLRHANGVTCVSSSVANTFKARFPGHAWKFKPITLGVDTVKFQPRSKTYKYNLRKRYGLAHTYNLLFVGRIIPKKGLHTLVKAAALLRKRHKNIAVIAVGSSWPGVTRETAYMRRVKRFARRWGVPIIFTGYIPPSRIHEMYHMADVFVCPTRYKEGFACVNSEAMASGIPVVASGRGGILEVIQQGKSGILVKRYTSANAFAKAISRIKTRPGLAKRLAVNGRARAVSRFSWNSTVRNLKSYYRSKM